MANKQNQNQISNLANEELGYDYIEIEYILQEENDQKKEAEQKEKEKYTLSAKLSRKELRKDRRSRQKSWIEINHKEHKYQESTMERRMFR